MCKKLDRWLVDHPTQAETFAADIEVTPMALSRYRSGGRVPKPAQMCLIYKATSGEIEPNNFYDLPTIRRR